MEGNGKSNNYQPVMKVVWGTIRFILVTLNNLWAVPTYILWCYILWPLRPLTPELYQRIEQIPYRWLEYCVAHWLSTAGYEIYESGDEVNELLVRQQCLVVFNHQSTSDVPIVMTLLADNRKYPLGKQVCWIMDQMFRYFHFGIVSSFHGDFFIQQGRETRQNQSVELKKHLETVYRTRDRTAVLVFPEGGFFYKRKESSQAYARKHGYPLLEHTTLPRIGAVETIFKTLAQSSTNSVNNSEPHAEPFHSGEPLEWFVDVTLAYPGGDPLDVVDVFTAKRPPCSTIVHYRCYPVKNIPWQDSDSLLKWIYERWAEKDAMLDEYYKTGKFPCSKYPGMMPAKVEEGSDGLRKLPFDVKWVLLYNVIFMFSTYCHVKMFTFAWSLICSLISLIC